MSDDYLWDGSGTPDPDVERLEHLLGRLRSTATAPRLLDMVRLKPDTTYDGSMADTTCVATNVATVVTARWRTVRFLAPMLAAAAVIIAMVGLTWRPADPAASWQVASISGQPRIGSQRLSGNSRLEVGQTLTTDATSSARLDVGTIGQVTVDANTRVRLVATGEDHHQLALERGTLHAFIAAPPGQFVVDTPSARATDLGCAYDLYVDEDGSSLLTVVSGWVAFEDNGRESFVPAGASSRTDRANGPGTPRYDDAEQAFREALDAVDYGRDRAASLSFVLEHARVRDAMTLWHLIPRVESRDRAAVVDALAARVPVPPVVTRDAVLRLDRAALDQWWDALGLDDASWWRMWKGRIPVAQTSGAVPIAADACPITPTVREAPPKDPSADSFGDGPWHVNADRTIWVHNWSVQGWQQGLNQKVMWIRPAGTDLEISGERLDAPAPRLEAPIPCQTPCFRTGFLTSRVTFPTTGCWRVTAKAGKSEMSFVTNVLRRP